MLRKKHVFILLACVLAIALAFSSIALAKTASESISEPQGDTVVFTVSIGAEKITYTWDDVSGKSKKFTTTTATYSSGSAGAQVEGGQEWTGVLVSNILADVEKQLEITLADDYKIKAAAVDGFVSAFTVGEVKDADRRYMLVCDPVSNKDEDGTETYPDSYTRIVRGTLEETSNQTNIRCLAKIEILDAAGASLDLAAEENPEEQPDEKPDLAKHPFTDLSNYAWADDAISRLYADKIVTGVLANAYGPANPIKRGDFMLMLVRAFEFTAEDEGNFSDVPTGSYYAEAIAIAKTLGIAQGSGELFNPESPLTREDGIVLLHRALVIMKKEFTTTDDLAKFTDKNQISDYAIEAMQQMVGSGLISGSNSQLSPKATLNRAQMAVMLDNALATDK